MTSSSFGIQQQQNLSSFYVQQMGAEQGPYDFMSLQQMVRSEMVKGETVVRRAEGGNPFLAKEIPGLFSPKSWLVAVLISFFVGGLGIDRFYMGHIGLGILKLVTLGGFGVWAIIDFILFLLRKVKDSNGLPLA
ncbi:MAG: domain containing protein [Thermoleophilia bacterium]|nr:domain containing protein [Thermoleophilia bacterium]MCZ4495728.1 domain containing protein [Thermoleophilia bacterium]